MVDRSTELGVVAAGRRTTGGATPENAVRALLTEPVDSIERDLGFTSAIPAATVLHSVTVDGSIATVDLSQEFTSGGGSLSSPSGDVCRAGTR